MSRGWWGALLALVIAAGLLGPGLASYVVMPHAVRLAWPAMAVVLVPAAATVLGALAFHSWRPQLEEPLATTAAAWLKGELQRSSRIGVTVAALEPKHNRTSFYHHGTATIVLAEDVLGDHSARAHATAAHELGHAIVHGDRPRLSRLTHLARARADSALHAGGGLLVGAVLVGPAVLRLVAVALLAVAMLLQALVTVDEVMASAVARTLLRGHLGQPEQVRSATGHLRRALATYGFRLAGTMAAFALATRVAAEPHGPRLPPGAPLTGHEHLVAIIIAAVAVGGALATLITFNRVPRSKLGLICGVLMVLSTAWSPLLVALVCDQGRAPAWAIACAAVPAWLVLAIPPLSAIQYLGGLLTRDLDAVSMPLAIRRVEIRRDAQSRLDDHDEPSGLVERITAVLHLCWIAPLALWWLL